MNPCAPASLPGQARQHLQAKAGIHAALVGSSTAFVWNAKMIRSLVIESPLVAEHTKPSWINSLAPVAPASLANFNSQAGAGDRCRERERGEGKANKTHVRCRQRVYHLQPVKFIFVQPRLVMRYGSPYSATDSTPNPTPSQPPLPPTLCQVNCERERFGKQKVASANRLEAFRALPNENIFHLLPSPHIPYHG